MEYEYILFDLDGTIIESGPGVINSILYALKKYGIEVRDRNEVVKFIGPPLVDSFGKYYGFSKEKAKIAVEYWREYYKEKGIFESSVYDGFECLLKTLKENNKTLIVATSKPQVFAKQVLEYFDIAKYFTYIVGSNLDGTRIKKEEVIRYALEICNITDLSKAIMIGDRKYDITAAKKVGISSIGVLYGYGDKAELQRAGADFISDTVKDIEKVLLVP